MLGKIKDIGLNLVEKSVDEVTNVKNTGLDLAEKGIDKATDLKASTQEMYINLSDVPEKTKDELFKSFSDNKESIILRVRDELTEDINNKLLVLILYGLIPFPLSLLISEEVFIQIVKESPEFLEVLFESAPEILELVCESAPEILEMAAE